MKKLMLLLPVVLLSACATTGTNVYTKPAASRTNFVIASTTQDIGYTYDANTDTYTDSINLSKAPYYKTDNLLVQLDRAYSSLEMEINETDIEWTIIEGKLDDREVSRFSNTPQDIYVLIFKDLKQRNFVRVIFNKHQKEFFDKARPGDNIRALCMYRSIGSRYLYASIWEHTIRFSGCLPLN
ncbi:hypothetical protein AAIR98_001323 [Elusimicrobium simillimum]|uniref:hypothetical protein n=1 Tax=Elusimicrobium simillimum TaxID=3143438 RepID=UPI003C6F54BF